MTSKERALRNYTFQSIDRFTIDFCASSDVYARLRQYYGVKSDLELMEVLHVDFRYPKPQWIGFPLVDGEGRPTDYFGIPRTGVGDFGYPIVHPLAHVSCLADVEDYRKWPTPEMWDYDQYARDCAQFDQHAVYGGAWAWFFEAACELVGRGRMRAGVCERGLSREVPGPRRPPMKSWCPRAVAHEIDWPTAPPPPKCPTPGGSSRADRPPDQLGAGAR